MRKIISFTTIVALAFVLVTPANAVIKKVAQTGLQFLKIDMSARSAAMGGAFIMVGDDANAMFYNSAGIAKVQSGVDAFATQTQWIADISYSAAGLVYSLGNLGSVGVNVISANYGDIVGTKVAPEGYVKTGDLNVGALSVGAVYARQFTNKFALGGQVRYAYQHLGNSDIPIIAGEAAVETVENEVSGLAFEVGTMFYPGLINSLRLGMSIKNFSPQFKYQEEAFQLPLTFTIGVAVDVLDILGAGGGIHSLLVAIDALHPRDYTERIHLGAEYWFMNTLALRGGYKTNYDEEDLCLGFGLKREIMGGVALKIDYAYTSFGRFKNVNRFTLGVSF